MIGQLWSALAAIGSGLVLTAVAAGADPWVAAPLLTATALEVVWGVLVMRAGRILAPGTAIGVCAVLGLAAILMLFTRTIGLAPCLALVGLHWITAVFAAVSLRGERREQRLDPRPRAFLLTLTAQAMIVAAIITPALAETEPGASAVPHGTSTHSHH